MKKWYLSKTIIFNVIIAFLAVVPQLKFFTPDVLAAITLVGNGIIRIFFTDTAIEKTVV